MEAVTTDNTLAIVLSILNRLSRRE